MRDRRCARPPRVAVLLGALAGACLLARAHAYDLMPIDPEGEVAARLAALLGEAPARIYPLGRDGFLHRDAGGALWCTSLASGASAPVVTDLSAIVDVLSDNDERTAVLVRAEENDAEIGSSHYRVYLVRPDCGHRDVHVLTATRDARAEMCGRGPAIGVERAQRVLAHALELRNGRLNAIRLEVVEHDCVSGEIRKRSVSRTLAGGGAQDAGAARGEPSAFVVPCYCD